MVLSRFASCFGVLCASVSPQLVISTDWNTSESVPGFLKCAYLYSVLFSGRFSTELLGNCFRPRGNYYYKFECLFIRTKLPGSHSLNLPPTIGCFSFAAERLKYVPHARTPQLAVGESTEILVVMMQSCFDCWRVLFMVSSGNHPEERITDAWPTVVRGICLHFPSPRYFVLYARPSFRDSATCGRASGQE